MSNQALLLINLVVDMHAMSCVHHADLSVGAERLMTMKKGQKINHFYGMLAICRKKSLFRSLSTMHKYAPFKDIHLHPYS
jgi:hypothetical protein